MKVYLARFEKYSDVGCPSSDSKFVYKIGHTKWFDPIKRFQTEAQRYQKEANNKFDSQYSFFDDVKILADIYIEHQDPTIAREYVKLIEVSLQAVYPKNLWFEAYFHIDDPKFFSGMSGITECFVLDGRKEQDLIKVFDRINSKLRKLGKIKKENLCEQN